MSVLGRLLRGRISAPLLALALGCALVEGAARLHLLPMPVFAMDADGWWRARWLDASAGDRLPRAPQAIDRFDPVLGWTLRENLRNVPFDRATVNSNSRGMRGVREYPLAKGSAPRMVAIGDSFTFGECVNDSETFAAYLEQLIPGSEILNLGVRGYGHDQQLLRLQREGVQYRPDVIVLGFYEGDVSRNALSFREYAKPHFSIVNGSLVIDNLPIPSPEALAARFHLRALDHLNVLATRVRRRRIADENHDRTRRILDQMLAESRAINATFLQLYLPRADDVFDNRSDPSELFTYGCREAGVVCVDPTTAMHRAVPDRATLREWFHCHYSPQIHKIVAEQVRDAVARAQLR